MEQNGKNAWTRPLWWSVRLNSIQTLFASSAPMSGTFSREGGPHFRGLKRKGSGNSTVYKYYCLLSPSVLIRLLLLFRLTYEELQVLETVKIVSEYITIVKMEFFDLKFLRNLQIIEGRKLHKWVNRRENKTELQNVLVSAGRWPFSCVTTSWSWVWTIWNLSKQEQCWSTRIIDCVMYPPLTGDPSSRRKGKETKLLWWQHATGIRLFAVRYFKHVFILVVHIPVNEKEVCDTNCNDRGCWGKEPSDCLECRTWNNMGSCVAKCETIGFVFFSFAPQPKHLSRYLRNQTSMKCQKCSPECETCNGLGEFDCLSCRHFTLYNPDFGNRMECVNQCPNETHFSTPKKICEECHPTCYDNGYGSCFTIFGKARFRCTGPDSTLGLGGCNKCKYAVKYENGTVFCLKSSGMNNVCAENDLPDFYISVTPTEGVTETVCAYVLTTTIVIFQHCERCSPYCKTCTSAGKSVLVNDCVCKHFEYQPSPTDRICIEKCPINSFLITTANETGFGVCRKCHPECDQNYHCSNDLPTGCSKCKSFAVFREDDIVVWFISSTRKHITVPGMRRGVSSIPAVLKPSEWRMSRLWYCVETEQDSHADHQHCFYGICTHVPFYCGI